MIRRHWSSVVRLLLVGAVIFLLFHFDVIHLEAIQQGLGSPWALLGSIVCVFAALNISIARWMIILRVQGFKLPFSRIWHISFMGAFANVFLPGGLGGDALRMYYVEREGGGRRGGASLSVVADRMMGLVGLIVAAGLIVLFNFDAVMSSQPLSQVAVAVGLMLGGIIVALALLRFLGSHGPVRHWILQWTERSGVVGRVLAVLIDVMRVYRKSSAEMVIGLGLSVIIQFLMAGAIVSIARSMDLNGLSPLDAALAGLLSYLANMVPITPGGIGIGEGAFDQICRLLTGDVSNAPFGTVFFIVRAVSYCVVLPGALSYILYGKPRTEALNEWNTTS